MPEKFKSKLRKKLSDKAEKNKSGGRSLGYKTRKGGYKEVSVPKGQRTSYFNQLTGKVVAASKKRAHEILGGKLKDKATEVHKGLTDTRHPAQLIPAYQKGRTLAELIKALTNK